MFVSGVLLTVMLFIVPPTFGVSDGDKVSFYEYFYGDSGRGLGASHQTGWTALVAELISEYGENANVSRMAANANDAPMVADARE